MGTKNNLRVKSSFFVCVCVCTLWYTHEADSGRGSVLVQPHGFSGWGITSKDLLGLYDPARMQTHPELQCDLDGVWTRP